MSFLVVILAVLKCHGSLSHQNWRNPQESNWHYRHDYDNLEDENKIVFPEHDDDYYPTGWEYTTTTRRPPNDNNIQSCVSSCPVTSFNPVCGTNDVTYQNIDQLRCAFRCGLDIRVKQWSACNMDTESRRNILQACMNRCPVTPEYLPVCGTDNITYNNIGKLYCAQNCGVQVQLKRRAPCPTMPSDLPTTERNFDRISKCILDCPGTSEYNPVCGTDGVTYTNEGKLQCARDCGVDVSIRGRTSCFLLSSVTRSTPTTETTSDFPFPSMTTQATNFTVPQHILDIIFTSPSDDDDYLPIDPRRDNVSQK
ncbi:unnamed protein product [Leptosia nina]|uniref:Kazal-like domain-containing protein n=1 Tax=Leptosia nina TaxID=320188 RepID=A0AAV1K1K1_9NEOP